jgi:NitT/TauT family transport system permease protein
MRGVRYACEFLLPPLVLLLLLLAAWEGSIRLWGLPSYLLPRPGAVAATALRDAPQLLSAMGYTLWAAACGFLLSLALGSVVAMLFAQSSLIRRAGYPYAIFLQTVPIVAIAPLVIAVMGQNLRSVILIAVVISLFPIITNVTAGLLAVDPKLVELFRVLRASRWQRLVKLQIPTAVPYLLTGAKTSSGLAMVGAIVGEFFAGYGQEKYGLGYLIQANSDALRTDKLFAAVLAAALLGVAIFTLVNLLAGLLLRRWTDA